MEIKLDIFETMALATIVFYFGAYIRKRIKVLEKYCIPSAVVGGMIFSIIMLVCKLNGILTISLDTTLQQVFMTAFFTSIGYTASFRLLKQGGVKVIIFLILSTILVITQNILGVSLASAFKLNPLLGLTTGSIPLVGGHGTSGSFGPLLEGMGVKGATTVAFASATFGLVMGSILGGFAAKTLIERNKLKTVKEYRDKTIPVSDFHQDNEAVLSHKKLMNGAAWIFLAMGIGAIITKFMEGLGLTFPSYIGAMLAAAIIKNICDLRKVKLEDKEIETLGGISLSFFLSLALMGLKLWELFDLALPLIIMLIAQTILMFVFGYYIVFRVMGKDYEAAVFVSALSGFGMGSTANAVANMDALTDKYGFAKTPYLVVPIVGCLFIDFINSFVITIFINIFG
ncbi:sodium/glutamate symporter [Caproiciproducens sp. MSJ-32]|uniref:sodium/glutamate symporter n=1 Tax=Caproiciproducens sp. MSJ-32 TaxID=2841527 RepID=UPI001C0FEAF9|nr:sodium/glutamate symporter [Caproiciproducens sp. MSJ-32]MBU5456073.1 sodium/glutamate symporter [Caproiciproducens sp. MSJ-32]